MKIQMLILAETKQIDARSVQSALQSIPTFQSRPIGAERGIATGTGSLAKWTAETSGSPETIADALIQEFRSRAAGGGVKAQIGNQVVEVNDKNRGQLIELLDKATRLSNSAAAL